MITILSDSDSDADDELQGQNQEQGGQGRTRLAGGEITIKDEEGVGVSGTCGSDVLDITDGNGSCHDGDDDGTADDDDAFVEAMQTRETDQAATGTSSPDPAADPLTTSKPTELQCTMVECDQGAGAGGIRFKEVATMLHDQGWSIPADRAVSPAISFFVRPHATEKDPAEMTNGVDYFESEQQVEAFLESRELVGYAVKCAGAGRGDSTGQRRGVVVALVAARPRSRFEGQLFQLAFQDGELEVMRRREVMCIVDDSRGDKPEECPICFDEYGKDASDQGPDGDGGEGDEGGRAHKVGKRVKALFKNNPRHWPGQIESVNGDGTYCVLFDDGDRDFEVAESSIMPINVSSEDGDRGPHDKDPTMLSCGHVMCHSCAGTMHSNEQESGGASSNTRSGAAPIKCPQCRAVTRRPQYMEQAADIPDDDDVDESQSLSWKTRAVTKQGRPVQAPTGVYEVEHILNKHIFKKNTE